MDNWALHQYSLIVYNMNQIITAFEMKYFLVQMLFHILRYFGSNSGSIAFSGALESVTVSPTQFGTLRSLSIYTCIALYVFIYKST